MFLIILDKIGKLVSVILITILVLFIMLLGYGFVSGIADKMTEENYPSAKELGNSEWSNEESNINLTIFDGGMYGKIITNEKTYDIKFWIPHGYKPLFDHKSIEIYHASYNCETKLLESKYIMYADYRYKDGKIIIDDFEFSDNYQTDSEDKKNIIEFLKNTEDITLYKKRDIDDTLIQKWECVEMKMEFFTFDETDVYAYGRIPESPFFFEKDNGMYEPVEITKSYDNYYQINITTGRQVYISTILWEKREDEMVFTILEPFYFQEDHKQYFPENMSQLTFRKCQT